MAPQREREREVEDPKEYFRWQSIKFKKLNPPHLLAIRELFSVALKNGDQATAHYFNRISNPLVKSYSASAQLLRHNVYRRHVIEARINREYDLASCLMLLPRYLRDGN